MGISLTDIYLEQTLKSDKLKANIKNMESSLTFV